MKKNALPLNTSRSHRVALLFLAAWLIGYAFISARTLMDFPFVHSDELWLVKIAETLSVRESFSNTEPFFDLYPRTGHPFRWLYTLLLVPMRTALGSGVFAIRALSLVGGLLALIGFSALLKQLRWGPWTRALAVVALSLNIQFIYSVHTGRQETWILACLILGLYAIASDKRPALLSGIVLLAMGIHPNSFIIGAAMIAWLMVEIFICHRRPLKDLFKFVGYTAVGAAVYVTMGQLMRPGFLKAYFAYGAALGTDAAPIDRLTGLYWYIYKLFHQIGGTYLLMDIRLYLGLTGLGALIWAVTYPFRTSAPRSTPISPWPRTGTSALAVLAAIVAAIVIIGRYNQLAIVFIMPFFIMLAVSCVAILAVGFIRFQSRTTGAAVAAAVLLLLSGINSISNLSTYDRTHFYERPYAEMVAHLKRVIPKDAVVLGNLNTIEAFDPNHFYDIRNLGYLDANALDVVTYLKTRGVQYVVVHEEMDYLYRTRPKWDFLYVNIDYHPALMEYLNTHATCVDTFENPTYAMRIARYTGTYPWVTRIYKLSP